MTVMTNRELGSIFDQRGFELLERAVLLGLGDNELRQNLVVNAQMVLQLRADLGD